MRTHNVKVNVILDSIESGRSVSTEIQFLEKSELELLLEHVIDDYQKQADELLTTSPNSIGDIIHDLRLECEWLRKDLWKKCFMPHYTQENDFILNKVSDAVDKHLKEFPKIQEKTYLKKEK